MRKGLCVSLGSFVLVMVISAFGSVTVPAWASSDQIAPSGQIVIAEEKSSMEQSAEKMERDPCKGPPVACVGVNVSQFPYPGCNSGQRCSYDTQGKSCGTMGLGTICQTVNMNGTCACQCTK